MMGTGIRKFYIILIAMIAIVFTVSCAAETDDELKGELPEAIVLDPDDSDSVSIFWGMMDVYIATPDKDLEIYEFLSGKLPMTFSFVETYPTDLKTGEQYGMSFFSGEEELFTFELNDGEHIVYEGGFYKADDPDWKFTMKELTEFMESYATDENR